VPYRLHNPNAARPCRTTALTLVETMITLLVIAIAAAIVVPRLGSTNVTRLKAAAELLIADLAYAQAESISHSDDPRVVIFDTSAHTYGVFAASDTSTPLTSPTTGQPYVVDFGSGRAAGLSDVKLLSLSVGGDNTLGFGKYGQLDQTGDATITLRCHGKQVTITVDPVTGEASVSAISDDTS